MNSRLLFSVVIAVAFTAAANSQNSGTATQDPGSAQPSGQSAGQNANSGQGSGQDDGQGQHKGRGGFGGGGGMMGHGLMGTVTAVATDHYTIKTDAGDVYTVNFTTDTRMFKRQARTGRPGAGQGEGGDQAGGRRRGMGGGNPPEQIKATDIKTGDVINVMGEPDVTAKSVNARAVALMDQQTVDQIRAMEANFGKTWLMGKVTAIDGTKITLTGVLNNAPYSVVANENTAFRKRRDPITLADIQVGDTVRADGAVKDGVFVAANVDVFSGSGGETPSVPRGETPQVPHSGSPQNSAPQ